LSTAKNGGAKSSIGEPHSLPRVSIARLFHDFILAAQPMKYPDPIYFKVPSR
jgi:hypothetical protein